MDFRLNYLQCRISSVGRVGYMRLHECNFYKVYTICRLLFACSNGISLINLDQGYNTEVVEEWLQDEDLYTIPIEPIIVGPFVPELVEIQLWNMDENNMGFPIVPIRVEDEENVSRNAG